MSRKLLWTPNFLYFGLLTGTRCGKSLQVWSSKLLVQGLNGNFKTRHESFSVLFKISSISQVYITYKTFFESFLQVWGQRRKSLCKLFSILLHIKEYAFERVLNMRLNIKEYAFERHQQWGFVSQDSSDFQQLSHKLHSQFFKLPFHLHKEPKRRIFLW